MNKEHFYEKILQKCASKASPRPFLILGNNPKQPSYARNYFKNKIFKEDYQKSLEKLNIRLLNPFPFNGNKRL